MKIDNVNYCATCGDRLYRDEMARCDGCDKAPTFCTCVQRRRDEQRRRLTRARSRATDSEIARRDDRIPMDLSGEEYARVSQRRETTRLVELIGPSLDPGIRRYVEVLRSNGVETYESCQGGPDPERPDRGHAYPEPSVRFHGTQGAGWWALQVCLDYGFPVKSLARIWTIEDREPHGPTWQLVFREMAEPETTEEER